MISEFELETWFKDANRMITCTGCYGVGEDRWNPGRACPTCSGNGKAAAEPHVLRLIDRIKTLESDLLETQYAAARCNDDANQLRGMLNEYVEDETCLAIPECTEEDVVCITCRARQMLGMEVGD